MFQYQKISLSDFTGGITDKYIDGPPNAYQTCVNMDITKFGTLETRRGFKWYLETDSNSYATTAAWSFLGMLRRPSADDVIVVAEHDDFYVVDDEIEFTFDTKDITQPMGYSAITFSEANNLATDDELYIKNVTDIDVGISQDVRYNFLAIEAPPATTGRLSLTPSGDPITLTASSYSKTVTLVKKATTTAVTTPNGGSLLKASTIDANQPVCFTEWQGQMLTTSKSDISGSATGTNIARPARIFNGAAARIFRTKTDAVHGSDVIEFKTEHGFADGDKVIYRELSVANQISTDDTEFYVEKVVNDKKVKLFTNSDLETGQLTWTEQSSDGIAALIPVTGSSVGWYGHTMGLPKPCVEADGTFDLTNFAVEDNSSSGTGTDGTFLFKCVYKYIYKANDIEYTVYGPPSDSDSVALTNKGTFIFKATLPYLDIPTGGLYEGCEWDLERVNIEVYRTIANGSDYYYVTEVPNILGDEDGKIVDVAITGTDTDLINNKPLYTTGGTVELWPAPKSKYIINARDIAYYCNTVEEYLDSEGSVKSLRQKARPNRVYQSVPGITGAIGDNFYVDVDDDIVGVGQINGLPIVFTSSFIYRLEGTIDATGAGTFRTRVIDENVGCVSHASVVSTPQGIYFAGQDGFYRTDGYKLQSLTEDLDNSYSDITETVTQKELVTGAYDPKDQRVYWGVAKKGSILPDEVWVLHLSSHGFTKMDSINFEATSMVVRDGVLFRGDTLGFVYRHSKDYKHDYVRSYSEPTITNEDGTLLAVYDWAKRYIDFKYISSATSFGAPSTRKWVNEAIFSLETEGNMGIKPVSINDANNIESDMKEITRENTWSWNDPDFAWGDSSADPSVSNFRWGTPDAITKPRKFPRRESRCRQKQVGLVPIKYKKYFSGTWGACTLTYSASGESQGLYTATLSGNWPENLDGGFIYIPTLFDGDAKRYNYNSSSSTYSEFKILDKPTPTTITFRGIIGEFTGENMAWHIKNYALEQRIEIKEIALKFGVIENVEGRFQTEDEVSG